MEKLKRTEFRIGNLVEDENGYYQIISDYLDEKYFDTLQTWGIELTEEILLKLGFTKSITLDKYFTINNDLAISSADTKFRFIQGNFVCQLVLVELQYVHQLQNIYFALCGKELDLTKLIKEK